MVILAVDYGDVRTGVAVCDKFEMLASPVCVITQRNPEILIEEIKKLASDHKVEQFVVGLPKNMDSSVGERAIKCTEFAEKLIAKKCHYTETEHTFDFDGVTVEDIEQTSKEMKEAPK